MSEGITEEQFREAIDRLARTPDGGLLYLYLQRRLMAISTATDGGALRVDAGERQFASRLIGLMAKGMQERGGRTGSNDDTSSGSARPIVFAVGGPRSTGGSTGRGTRRRVPTGPVTGWDTPDDTGSAG
jgi:hypothetical protein